MLHKKGFFWINLIAQQTDNMIVFAEIDGIVLVFWPNRQTKFWRYK